MEIKITEYDKAFSDSHIEFVKRNWKRERLKHPEYLFWKFRATSEQIIDGLIVALEDDKVIGQNGFIPFDLMVNNKRYPSQWSCDTMVDVDYRGKGIGLKLYNYASQKKIITMGSNPSPSNAKSRLRAGSIFMKGSWKVAFVKNLFEVAKIKRRNYPILKLIPNPLFYFNYLLAIASKQRFNEITPSRFAELYNASKSDEYAYSYLTPEFLEWRFRPFKNYYQGIKAYANENGDYYAGFLYNSVYYLCDYHTKSPNGIFKLIHHILSQTSLKDINMIRFMANVVNKPTWMIKFGFIPFGTVSEVYYVSQDQEVLDAMKGKRFYYSYLDSDENI